MRPIYTGYLREKTDRLEDALQRLERSPKNMDVLAEVAQYASSLTREAAGLMRRLKELEERTVELERFWAEKLWLEQMKEMDKNNVFLPTVTVDDERTATAYWRSEQQYGVKTLVLSVIT